jgi:hypothetical protein
MPDDTTIPDEDRMSAAVVRLRKNVVDAYKFRPTDAALQSDFNTFLDDMLQTLIETTTAAAIDKAKIIVTKELSMQRQQFQLEALQMRSQTDVDNRKLGGDIAATMLKIASGQ